MLPAWAVSAASTARLFANSVMSPAGATVRSDCTAMSSAAIFTAPRPKPFSRVVSRCRMPLRSSGSAVARSRPAATAATRSDSTT
ncbi:hypothetical protein G6F32_017173 [Rhizopus arrhizus]|nr:hypothetical protein G6F32_017173 [Rhizopus arrhizus]